MFGALFGLLRRGFWRNPYWLIVFVYVPQALGAQPAPDALVEQFLTKHQLNSVAYLEENLSNFRSIHNCLNEASSCESNPIITTGMEGDILAEFDQQGLVDYIKERHDEYRILIGIHSFSAIQSGLRIGRGRMSITPIRGVGAVFFETRTEAGKEEWAYIEEIVETEFSEIENFNEIIASASIELPEASRRSLREMMGSQILSMSQKFPFLRHLRKVNPNMTQITKAIRKVMDSYVDSLTHIATLKGKDRYELFGFAATLAITLLEMSDDERAQIEEHFQYIEETTTIWSQIVALLTSKYFIGMVVCWTAAIFVPPVAVLCGAIGIGFAIPGVIKLGFQVNRLGDFMNTGEFSHDIYTKYMMGVALTAGMYAIWARTSVPGFVRNVGAVRQKTREVIAKIRLNSRTAFGSTRDFLNGEWAVIKDYFKFYLKDFGSDEVVNAMMTSAGDVGLKALFPNLQRAFQQSLVRVNTRAPRVFLYSDFLKVTSNAL